MRLKRGQTLFDQVKKKTTKDKLEEIRGYNYKSRKISPQTKN